MNEWKKQDEERYLLEPVCRDSQAKLNIAIPKEFSQTPDPDEEAIVSGYWEYQGTLCYNSQMMFI